MNTCIDSPVSRNPADQSFQSALVRLRSSLVAARAALAHGRRRRLAIRDLRILSDRELSDIGIERGRIPEVVDGLLAREARDTSTTTVGAASNPATVQYAGHCNA